MNDKIRPVLKNLINSNTSDLERFQNEVIRQIIKMQNNLLVAFFNNYIRNRKIEFNKLEAWNSILRLLIICYPNYEWWLG